MPAIKNILAVIGDVKSGRTILQGTLDAARHLQSHVDVLHVRPDPVTSLPMVSEAMSGNMAEEMMAVAERESAARAKELRGLFDRLSGDVAMSWIEDSGVEGQVLAVRACRADMIVLGRPTAENEAAALMTLNAGLMQSGRPVLMVPATGPLSFKHVAVFWNGSPEATRAVTAGLAFLTSAGTVTVLRVAEEEWFAPTEDLEAFFAHHGISIAVVKVMPRSGGTGAALLAAAVEAGADMMVMGAYTRSKLRQLILGSVTGYVVQNAGMPVLLSH